MGFLLKTKDEDDIESVRMFYSEPSNGCFVDDDNTTLSQEEYDEWCRENKYEINDFVFMKGWFDCSEVDFTKPETRGIEVDKFVLDCILQGQELELNKPIEFEIKKNKSMTSIKYIKNWKNKEEMYEHCRHIISHSERYVAERVFEAKRILNYKE